MLTFRKTTPPVTAHTSPYGVAVTLSANGMKNYRNVALFRVNTDGPRLKVAVRGAASADTPNRTKAATSGGAPPPPGTCFNFHSGRRGGPLPPGPPPPLPWTPSPPPPPPLKQVPAPPPPFATGIWTSTLYDDHTDAHGGAMLSGTHQVPPTFPLPHTYSVMHNPPAPPPRRTDRPCLSPQPGRMRGRTLCQRAFNGQRTSNELRRR